MKKNINQRINPLSRYRGTSHPPTGIFDLTGRLSFGFTLVELLVVIAIISILTMISVASFTSAQIKARDSERKSNLDAVSKSLMLYYTDNGKFPDVFVFGEVAVGFTGSDGTMYMRRTPLDPRNADDYTYVYKVTSDLKAFNLFANLENKQDSQCHQVDNSGEYSVDGKNYCYGISSPNTIIDPDQF